MKKFWLYLSTIILSLPLVSLTYASTTQQWRKILNEFRNKWRTDEEIKQAIEDLWYDSSDYFPNTNNTKTSGTTQEWRKILNQLRNQWWTDDEIKYAIEDLWYDYSAYFPSWNSSNTTYTSRSCKTYNIKYLDSLNVYTSDNLLRQEYFVTQDYFKRYVDSKNKYKSGCPTNIWWVSNTYEDYTNDNSRYTAPNGKVYFITQQNWTFTSSELSTSKRFSTINELKYYIRNHNPLISMAALWPIS